MGLTNDDAGDDCQCGHSLQDHDETDMAACEKCVCLAYGARDVDATIDTLRTRLAAAEARVALLDALLRRLEWRQGGYQVVAGRVMWTCPICKMTWREQKPTFGYSDVPKETESHSPGCAMAAALAGAAATKGEEATT